MDTITKTKASTELRVAISQPEISIKENNIDTLIEWRNLASKRIDDADHAIDAIETKLYKIMKKRASDARWARKLNKIIMKKALKDRPHRVP